MGENGRVEPDAVSPPGAKLLSRRARMIVHDLRNPLSVIRGYLQVASRSQGTEDEDGVRSYLDGALAATTELDEMIQSMLDLAVVEGGLSEAGRFLRPRRAHLDSRSRFDELAREQPLLGELFERVEGRLLDG